MRARWCSAGTSAPALALAEALGVNRLIAAELLPEIEQVAVRLTNEQMEGHRDG